MKIIASAPLWISELALPEDTLSTPELQSEITHFVEESRRTVTGAYLAQSAKLLLLHWPDTREGYTNQSLTNCDVMRTELAERLGALSATQYILAEDELFCMMGRRVGGYTDGRIADMNELVKFQDQLGMHPAHMVSARPRSDGSTESYSEPTALLEGKLTAEAAVHSIGDILQQHHYGIHRGTGATDFYETLWAAE